LISFPALSRNGWRERVVSRNQTVERANAQVGGHPHLACEGTTDHSKDNAPADSSMMSVGELFFVDYFTFILIGSAVMDSIVSLLGETTRRNYR
jgi:hypothetical protein